MLDTGRLFISVEKKEAKLVNGGTATFQTSLLDTCALAIARVVALEDEVLAKRGNTFFYISSVATTQRDILTAIQAYTKTEEKEWNGEFVGFGKGVEGES